MPRTGPTVQLTPIGPDLSRPRILRVSTERYRPFSLPRSIRVFLTPMLNKHNLTLRHTKFQAPTRASVASPRTKAQNGTAMLTLVSAISMKAMIFRAAKHLQTT